MSSMQNSATSAIQNSFDKRWTAFAAWLDRHSRFVVVGLLLYILLAAIGIASRKILWADDLVTVLTARLQSFGEIWRFYANGLDATSGPVQSLVGHIGIMLPLPTEIGVRFPFILAFLCMCFCIYRFVRSRYPAGIALAVFVMPVLFSELYYFMTAPRAYPLMLGATGLALYFWQNASEGRMRAWSILGLWLALAAATATNFFSVFLFVPFAAGQLTQDLTRKRPDWPVWLALLLFPAGFLPFAHGLLNESANFRAAFHGKPGLRNFEISYRGVYTSYGWVVVSVLLILAVWLLYRELRDGSHGENSLPETQGFTRPEWVLIVSLALLPVVEALGAMAIGVFEDKFAIPFYIGLILVIAGGFAEITRRRAAAGAMAFVAILGCAIAAQGRAAVNGIDALLRPTKVAARGTAAVMSAPPLQMAAASQLPIVTDLFHYEGLDYYGSEGIRQRLYIPIDSADYGDPKYKYTVTGQQCAKLFSRMLPMQTGEIDSFIRQHRHFLLLTEFDMHEWLPIYVLDRQRTKGDLTVTLLVADPSGDLLDVQAK